MSENANITVGVWRNHADGMLTLTLPAREAGYLSAFLVFFVSLVGRKSWSLAAFILHQLYANKSTGGGLHHQLRVLIRNTKTHTTTAWQCLKLIHTWRQQIGFRAAVAQSWVILSMAKLFVAGWTVAAIFISRIWTDAGDQFLVRSDFCGLFLSNAGGQTEVVQQVNSFNLRRVEAATTYVAQCYEGQTVPECGRLPVPRLNWTMTDHFCPFNLDSLCTNAGGTPVRFDSGHIDSNTHLGINSPAEDRLTYRKTASCSPIELRFKVVEATREIPQDEVHLFYGDRLQGGNVTSRSTFIYSTAWRTEIDGYRVFSFSYDPYLDESLIVWRPNTTIVNGVDPKVTSIFFLDANGLVSFNETRDPWFRNQYSHTLLGQFDVYAQRNSIRAMACIEENKLCNPTNGLCTEFTPSDNTDQLINKLALNPAQTGTFQRLMGQLIPLDLSFIAERMPSPLLASRTVQGSFQQAKLPDDQWRVELGRWFSVNLQLIQAGMIQMITRPAELADLIAFQDFSDVPVVAGDCQRQRVRNAVGFVNFNFSALIAVVVIGTVVIIAGLSVDKVVGFFQKRLGRGARPRTWWLLDGIFQLQRQAYEGVRVGPWENVDKAIPTTNATRLPSVDPAEHRIYLEPEHAQDALEMHVYTQSRQT